MDYDCKSCCFHNTPYCDKCASVETTSGKRKKPSMFVPLNTGVESVGIYFGVQPTEREAIQNHLVSLLQHGQTIEISLVARYNRLVSGERDSDG